MSAAATQEPTDAEVLTSHGWNCSLCPYPILYELWRADPRRAVVYEGVDWRGIPELQAAHRRCARRAKKVPR